MSIGDITSAIEELEKSWNAARAFWQDDDSGIFEERGVRTVLNSLERGFDVNQGFKKELSNADNHLRALIQEAQEI